MQPVEEEEERRQPSPREESTTPTSMDEEVLSRQSATSLLLPQQSSRARPEVLSHLFLLPDPPIPSTRTRNSCRSQESFDSSRRGTGNEERASALDLSTLNRNPNTLANLLPTPWDFSNKLPPSPPPPSAPQHQGANSLPPVSNPTSTFLLEHRRRQQLDRLGRSRGWRRSSQRTEGREVLRTRSREDLP